MSTTPAASGTGAGGSGKGKVDGKKFALVTGASSGIGLVIAEKLVAAGWTVIACARRKDKLAALASRLGPSLLPVVADVTQVEQLHAAAAVAGAQGIDLLVNNAGLMALSLWKNCDKDGGAHTAEWSKMVQVNVMGVLNGIQVVLPGMLQRGRGDIVTISSDAGRKVFPGGGVYCATKAAVEAITASLRLELAATSGIRFTSILPGATKSELGSHITDKDILSGPPIPFTFLEPDGENTASFLSPLIFSHSFLHCQ